MKYGKSALRSGKHSPPDGGRVIDPSLMCSNSSISSKYDEDPYLDWTKRSSMSPIGEEHSSYKSKSKSKSRSRSLSSSPKELDCKLEAAANTPNNSGTSLFANFPNEASPPPEQPPSSGRFDVQFSPSTRTFNPVSALSTKAASLQSKLKKVDVPSTGYGKFGPIQYRGDRVSILLKKWHTGYWLHVYPATINIFESMEEMDEWKEMNDAAQSNGVYLDSKTKKFMDKFVKKSINFDTTGDLQKKVKKMEEKNRKLAGDGSVGSSSRSRNKKNNKVGDSSSATLPVTYIMEQVRSKYYHRNEPLMHTCKISYLGLGGRNVTAAFGSTVPQELKRLRAVVRDITRLTKKATKKKHKKANKLPGDDSESTLTSMLKAQHISSAKSEVTALSNTIYGRNTMTNQAAAHQRATGR